MTRLPILVSMLLVLAACGRQEPPAPATSAVDPTVVNREKFFGDAAKDSTIEWRASGLGIKIITAGEGTAPTATDRIRVHYVGRLKDGKVFDDSHQRGKPADFVVNRL